MPDEPVIPKDVAIEIIEDLPADSTWDEIIRELLLHKMVEEGLADADAGRLIPHEQVVREVESWLKSSGRRVPPAA